MIIMANKQNKEQEVQQKYAEFQALQQQLQQINQQIEEISAAMEEIDLAKESVEYIKDLEEGDEMLIPLGASSFAIGTLKDTENVVVGLGSGVLSKKSIENTDKVMNERKNKFREIQEDLQGSVEELQSRLQKLQHDIQHAQQ